jgi:hypothetical protein
MILLQLHGALLLVWTPVVGNVVLAVWAEVVHRRGRRALPPAFWTVVLLTVAVLAVQAALGVLLIASGVRPAAGLHLLYAVLVVLVAAAQVGLRPTAFLRRLLTAAPGSLDEPRVLALLCLTQAALIMRAWMTGAFGR